jgi:hypothetical protein
MIADVPVQRSDGNRTFLDILPRAAKRAIGPDAVQQCDRPRSVTMLPRMTLGRRRASSAMMTRDHDIASAELAMGTATPVVADGQHQRSR